ncbi:MAG TPA: uroporphyrinogen-III C-methyltransferase [Burkholderiales bacterium]
MTEQANSTTPETADQPAAASRTRRRGAGVLLITAVLAIALAWSWWDARRQLESMRSEVAAQLRDNRDEAKAARVIASDVQESLRELQSTTAGIELKLLESQGQQDALESLYQEMNRSRDDWLLAEAEQTLNIAAQQLQLAGNVRAALTALQTVDARLARPDRPQFLSVRKVLARDIQRLQSAPMLDVTGMTLRLDQILENIDTMPIVVEAHPHETVPGAEKAAVGSIWWKDALYSGWTEIKQLIRVERLDAQDPTLLAPDQRYFLRENLKLRLLHARLALLQRDEQAFRNDLQASVSWFKRYFDTSDQTTANALAALEQMREAAVAVELPSIADSLNAVRGLKAPQERMP